MVNKISDDFLAELCSISVDDAESLLCFGGPLDGKTAPNLRRPFEAEVVADLHGQFETDRWGLPMRVIYNPQTFVTPDGLTRHCYVLASLTLGDALERARLLFARE